MINIKYRDVVSYIYQELPIFLAVPSICGTENDDCDKNLASCADTGSGLYECECSGGYVGNGKTCFG